MSFTEEDIDVMYALSVRFNRAHRADVVLRPVAGGRYRVIKNRQGITGGVFTKSEVLAHQRLEDALVLCGDRYMYFGEGEARFVVSR